MEVKIKISPLFADKKIKELLEYYKVGKVKIKDLSFHLNNEEVNLNSTLNLNDTLIISYHDEIDFLPFDKPLKVLYEDKNLLIVDKPKGLLVHPDDKSKNGTLCNIVSHYYHKTNQNISVRYLHRIDVDTSGIVMFAKDILSASYLNAMIASHDVAREYLCIASGKFIEDSGIYNDPIAEDRHIANKKRVSKNGKEAITTYTIKERLNKNLNLVLVKLKTGRTHQIRLHFSYHGHPLVGDGLYNGNTNLLDRQALHSYHVNFIHPITNKRIDVTSKLPYDMEKIYQKYRKKEN